jgi:hypothetical protein
MTFFTKLIYPYSLMFSIRKAKKLICLWDLSSTLRIKGDHKGFTFWFQFLWLMVELELTSCLHEEIK